MGFMEAFMGLLLVIIVLVMFIPVTQELLPSMVASMGSATGMMVSSIVLVIIACAIFIFMRQSMGQEDHMQMQGN